MSNCGYEGEKGEALWGWDDGSVLYSDERHSPVGPDGSHRSPPWEFDVTSDAALCARICALISEHLDARPQPEKES